MSELPVDVVAMPEQVADPGATAGTGKFYTKNSGGVTQSFYQASNGTVYQLTPFTPPAGSVSYQNLTTKLTIGPNSLANTSAAQPWFPASRDTITLAIGSYKLRADLWVNAVDGTGRTLSVLFTGTATIGGNLQCKTFITGVAGTLLGSNNTLTLLIVPSATPQQVTGNNSGQTRAVFMEGILTVSVAGTFVPQMQYSNGGANPITLLAHSYLELIPL